MKIRDFGSSPLRWLFLWTLLTLSTPASAYLDPGSGNALVCLAVSLFGAFVYYLKKVFWKVVGLFSGRRQEIRKDSEIVIFSEGKNYWLTFKPIVKSLIERKVHFRYLTMDVEDPALVIDNEFMHSRYVGEGSVGFGRIAAVQADLMLATTPNIGCEGFPLPRPRKVRQLVHVWHSVCDTAFYQLGALDHYDVALTVGDWVEESIRKVENARGLKPKRVVAVGVPYLDSLKESIRGFAEVKANPPTVLVAPSWGTKNCLKVYGMNFLTELANEGYQVIVRPHPQSFKVEFDFIEKLKEVLTPLKNCYVDDNPDGSVSMRKADLLISDKSSIRFDFAFLYERPVVTLDIPDEDLKQYEASLIGRLWEEDQASKIGIKITRSESSLIVESVRKALEMKAEDITLIRERSIVNWGCAGEAVSDWLISQKKNN